VFLFSEREKRESDNKIALGKTLDVKTFFE